jgi:hypothetical protein
MKRLLKRIGLWPSRAFRYYTAQVVESKVIGEKEYTFHRHEMRQESWVSWLFIKWRKQDSVVHKAW